MLKIAWDEIYAHPLPENHRFPMIKYNLIPEQLLYEGTITEENLFQPYPLDEQYITNTHDITYWQRLKNQELSRSEIRKTGFPMSEQLVQREITIMQGTLQAALFALEYGVAFNIAGGTHHAFTDRGEGFCLLNDIAIAANYLLEKQLAKQILIVDLDVHQGNGTAQIFCDQPSVFTFSMHGAKNYPMYKEKSDLDIPLADGTDDSTYLSLLNNYLDQLINEVQPDFIFFQSGVDVLASDKLGRLSLSIAGCRERDRVVLKRAKENKIPIALSMGGGYSSQIAHIVEAHANTYRLAQEIFF
ncbi:acetoin utilization deacetylase AcuC-like enzyme [Catalinimonas alkaloidigena]|uniref:histone deacetylase family protein n=1 Tax=Catalinimonas alkaloidigena TaxID=1075417 RepID=UPI0024064744|nr:histone deacetylase [Catalinimonas alkaloidigena]MDF9801198.1 acetoin utilization deacetylase AcuC-like enzyme [Catalinimonas alkaloidigena]